MPTTSSAPTSTASRATCPSPVPTSRTRRMPARCSAAIGRICSVYSASTPSVNPSCHHPAFCSHRSSATTRASRLPSPTMTRRHYKSFIDDSERWDRVALRDGHIVTDTPAKSGTAWMQMCVSLLVFRQPQPPRPMAEISPWIDMLTWPIDELVALLDAQDHRRFFKTHTPLDGIPWDPNLTYICVGRDPRDVMVSWENHMA